MSRLLTEGFTFHSYNNDNRADLANFVTHNGYPTLFSKDCLLICIGLDLSMDIPIRRLIAAEVHVQFLLLPGLCHTPNQK